MAKRTIHIVPHENGWAIKYEGTGRAYKVVSTQQAAKSFVLKLASPNGAEIVLHGKNGKIISRKKIEPGDESGCFITTACIRYYDLADDCYQLSFLRSFRDNYLLKTPQGKSLVAQYYLIAPQIVKILDDSPNKSNLYKDIFSEINRACLLIKERKFNDAKSVYKRVVTNLIKEFEL